MSSKPQKFCIQGSQGTITISDSESDMESTQPAAPKRIPPNKRYPRGFRFYLPPIDDNTPSTVTGK